MASRKTSLTLRSEILDSVDKWLKEEHELRLGSKANLQNVQPATRRAQILMSELPGKWESFQKLHTIQEREFLSSKRGLVDQRLLLRVGLSALQCAAAARESFVWTAVTHGYSLSSASDISWKVLNEYKNEVEDEKLKLPSLSRLIMPIEDAVKEDPSVGVAETAYGHPKVTLIGAVGLAATAVYEQSTHRYRAYWLPDPTSTISEVRPWIQG